MTPVSLSSNAAKMPIKIVVPAPLAPAPAPHDTTANKTRSIIAVIIASQHRHLVTLSPPSTSSSIHPASLSFTEYPRSVVLRIRSKKAYEAFFQDLSLLPKNLKKGPRKKRSRKYNKKPQHRTHSKKHRKSHEHALTTPSQKA